MSGSGRVRGCLTRSAEIEAASGMKKGTSRWQGGWAPGRKEWQEESLISEVERGVRSRKWLLFGVTGAVFRREDGIEETLVRQRSRGIHV